MITYTYCVAVSRPACDENTVGHTLAHAKTNKYWPRKTTIASEPPAKQPSERSIATQHSRQHEAQTDE
jgi:hypothetical protein